jgi:FkbM family methyltransferase
MNTLKEAELPDGTRVFAVRPKEVPVLYEQVQDYLRHGIEVHDGDIVFDVGANIGLFALWIQRQGRRNVRLYSFEPIPAVFEALRHNSERFDPENWKVFPCGLARQSGTATFGYHVRATALSTAYPDDSLEARVTMRDNVLRNLDQLPKSVRWMRWLPGFVLRPWLDYLIRRAFRIEKVECRLRTVSEIIREQAVTRIDLLKVDVEKAEQDVLEGIEADDWPKIQRIVLEVHDLDHRLARVTALLREKGFRTIVVEQEPIFKGSEIYNLYALREVPAG